MSVEVIQLGAGGGVTSVELGTVTPVTGVEIPAQAGPQRLDDLVDVEGADLAEVGQTLVKNVDQQWRPATVTSGPGETGPLSYLHSQDTPSTVWLISHGLAFTPSGIEVLDHVGERHHPQLSYPSAGVVRLDFLDSVRGTARLS